MDGAGVGGSGGHNVVAMRLEVERVRERGSAAGRKLRDRVALIEILPILRKAEKSENSVLWRRN